MVSEILFLAPYPNEHNIKDGMVSRVQAIDNFFVDTPRSYLSVGLRSQKKAHIYTDGQATIYELNLVRHFWRIVRLFRAHSHLYIQSIYSVSLLWFFVGKRHKITLDVHGVVPQEELYFYRNQRKARYMAWLERYIFGRLTTAVCVTHAMREHYRQTYPKFNGDYLIYGIMPSDLHPIEPKELDSIKAQHKDQIKVLYSGGAQGWQNVDLMLQTIESNLDPRVHYTILTGNTKAFAQKMEQYGLTSSQITLDSRDPKDLWRDYAAADYAFILRDDNVVNVVANPTKLVEYLFYGIIPIVLTPRIGDYQTLGYTYLSIEAFDAKTIEKPNKVCQNNREIAQNLIRQNNSVTFVEQILG